MLKTRQKPHVILDFDGTVTKRYLFRNNSTSKDVFFRMKNDSVDRLFQKVDNLREIFRTNLKKKQYEYFLLLKKMGLNTHLKKMGFKVTYAKSKIEINYEDEQDYKKKLYEKITLIDLKTKNDDLKIDISKIPDENIRGRFLLYYGFKKIDLSEFFFNLIITDEEIQEIIEAKDIHELLLNQLINLKTLTRFKFDVFMDLAIKSLNKEQILEIAKKIYENDSRENIENLFKLIAKRNANLVFSSYSYENLMDPFILDAKKIIGEANVFCIANNIVFKNQEIEIIQRIPDKIQATFLFLKNMGLVEKNKRIISSVAIDDSPYNLEKLSRSFEYVLYLINELEYEQKNKEIENMMKLHSNMIATISYEHDELSELLLILENIL